MSGALNARPTLASIESTSASVARPSWPRRSRDSELPSPEGIDGYPGSEVVSVTAAISRARNGPCSPAAYGTPRSTSCVGTDGTAGVAPVCSRTRAEAVLTRVGAGVRDPFPAIASRGGPAPPMPSSTMTANAARAYGEVVAKRYAPAPPYAPPSVDTSTSVRFGFAASTFSCGANPRAISIRAAVPDAFSPKTAPAPWLSRWATRTIAWEERPGMTVTTLWSSTVPRSGRSARHESSRASRPLAAIVCAYHRVASAAPRVPGTRDGYSLESWAASVAAASSSKSGWRVGRGSRPVVETENRRAKRAGTTTRDATRTRRTLRGLSTVPRRARRLRPRGRAASIAGL